MSNTNLITNNFKYQRVSRLIDDVTNNQYYLFVGDFIPHDNVTLQTISDDVNDTLVNAYHNMIMGKIVLTTDVFPVIKNIPWQTQLFAMYDDQDTNLAAEKFYCTVNEGSYYHIWKCLDNNNGANSTVQPSFAAGATSPLYQTSDGYRWKYMTSVAAATVSKFLTTDPYFPLVSNSSVTSVSLNGKIDIIAIQANAQGKWYNNYIDGSFSGNDIRINGDSTLFNISNNIVNHTNGYYTGCILYLTGGIGQGQYATIIDYGANATGNIIKTNQQFLVSPQNGTTYEIRPQVAVVGDGSQTINCVARALVNAVNSNSVYRIEVLNTGAGYTVASANVTANDVVGLDDDFITVIRPIIGPFGGHGYDVFNELYCADAEFSVTLSNTENSTLPTTNIYQQIGILRNPLFQDVEIDFTASTGNFSNGEQLFVINPQQFASNTTVNANSVFISCNNAAFLNQVAANDYVMISSLNTALNQLTQVNVVTNASSINVSSNVLFSCTQSILYYPNITANCLVSNVTNSTVVTVTNCPPVLETGTVMIGIQSGTLAMVNFIKRNNVVKFFDTFIQLHKYDATSVSGSFIQSERVFQGNSYGYLHHVDGTGMYLSEMTQTFQANTTNVRGETSGAIATLTKKYKRETMFGAGSIQYLENISPVTRANTQNETFQIVVHF